MPNKISIIIPTFNEIKNPFLWVTLNNLAMQGLANNLQIIIIDGGSTDGTLEKLSSYKSIELHKTQETKRGARLDIGYRKALHNTILLHHPRTILPFSAYQYLINNTLPPWGGFLHSFDDSKCLLKYTSFHSNYIRRKIFKILYLDHCIFCQKTHLDQIGGIPRLGIFEDTALSQKLANCAKPHLIPIKGITSSIRFNKNGFIKQSIKNQIFKIAYHLKLDLDKVNRLYEKKLDLNTKH